MLDDRVTEHTRRTMDTLREERWGPLARQVNEIRDRFTQAGSSGGSRMLIQIVALYKAELDIRVLMAWGHLQRALASFGIGGPETLAADLKAFMGEIIENEAASLFDHVSSSSSFRNARTRIIDPGQPLQEAKAHALRKVGGEIDLYVAALERAREPAREGSGNQINVFGQAIVQTGDFSLASMTVSLDENSKTEIVAARIS